jgi:hypothetical protein
MAKVGFGPTEIALTGGNRFGLTGIDCNGEGQFWPD